MKKLLIAAVSLIVIIAIALTVVIKIYVTPENVKAYIIPLAEQSLNRKVIVGSIDINLLKGIGLKEFTIKESDRETDFVKCREFVLKFQLLPLLTKQVIIDELKVVSPSVRIQRDKKGKYNFEDIGKKDLRNEKVEVEGGGIEKGLPISMLVNKISITDAKFSFADFMKKFPDIKSTGEVDISIKSADGSELVTEGSIKINIDEAVLRKPEKHIQNISANLNYAVTVNLQSEELIVNKADVELQKITASLKGTVRKFRSAPELDISVNVPETKTAHIQDLAALFAELKDITLSGAVAADLKVQGMIQNLESMNAKGSIALEKIGIAYDKINVLLDGSMKVDGNTMVIDLTGSSGNNVADLKGTVSSLFRNQNININVYSKRLFLDEVIPIGKKEAVASSGASGKTGNVSVPEREAGPLKLMLKAGGEVKVDSAIYKGMHMTDFYMQYLFKNNRLDIVKMTGNAGKGKFALNSFIDLSTPGYTYDLAVKIDSLHAEEIVNAFFPKAKNKVFGIITSNLKMTGNGTLPVNVKKNLLGDADFNIKDGKVTDAEITKELSRFINVGELETIKFTKAGGTVKITNGVAKLNSMFASNELSMDPKGSIGLDETLDLAFDLKLSPRLTDKAITSKIGKYMKDEGGWGTIPILVTGTFSDPKYGTDIAKAGQRVIERKVDKILDKLLNKGRQEEQPQKQQEPDQGTEKQTQEPGDQIKDILQQLPGLFGK